MHFAADRAAMGALCPVGRKQSCIRIDLVEIFSDRQRVPDFQVVVSKAWHQERRRQQEQFRSSRGIVCRDLPLFKIKARHFAQQPAAQRPRPVILACDAEYSLRHALALLAWMRIINDLQAPRRDGAARLTPNKPLACPLGRMFKFLSRCNKKSTSL